MALPETDILWSDVRDEMSESTDSEKELCTSESINPWGPYKPHAGTRSTRTHGLSRQSSGQYKLIYTGPDDNTGYSIGQFRGYNHASTPPVVFEITNVKTLGGTSIWNGGDPVLWAGDEYLFTFRYKLGTDYVDPSTISELTQLVKQSYGYGGITVLNNPRYQDQTYDIPLANVYSVVSTSWSTVTDFKAKIDWDITDPDTFNPTIHPLWVEYVNTITGGYVRRTYRKIETQFAVGSYPAFHDGLIAETKIQELWDFSIDYDGDYTTINFYFFYGNSRQINPDWFIELYALDDSLVKMGFGVSFRLTNTTHSTYADMIANATWTSWNHSVPESDDVYTFGDALGWVLNQNKWLQIQMQLSGDQRTAYNHVHFNAYNTPGALYLVEDIYEDTGH